MKHTKKTLLEIELMRGVPGFKLQECTRKYIEEIRGLLFRFILIDKSNTHNVQRDAMGEASEALAELEVEVNEMLEVRLAGFLHNV